ncbi:MAG: hypothetical protein ACKKMR_02010 [Candidatus Nealsonbacteria bacterium]
MNKLIRLLFLIIVLLLIVGGFFYWENQKDVMKLNKNLPEGVRVVKTLNGKYKVVNKIDGYEFKVRDEWGGIEEIEYIPERTEKGYTAASIEFEGRKGGSRIISIDRFKTELLDFNLGIWARTFFDTFELVGNFKEDKVGEFEILKTKEEVHLMGMYVYFFKKNSIIYAVTCGSEEFIQDIIINGKW